MIIKELKLRNFRNFKNCHISFIPNINIITGLNGQGKTNLLESLVFLSTTKSHRVNEDQKMIKINTEFSNIDCLYNDGIDYKIGAVIHQKGKSLLINKQYISKSSEFIGLLNVILFSPSDINIFNDSPRVRRKLMDLEITKVNKKYVNCLNNYQKLLKERNITLKNEKIDSIYLNTLEDQMIENQKYIIEERIKFIENINENINKYFKKINGEDLNIEIEYLSCVDCNEKNLDELLKDMYISNFERDRYTQLTNSGIHRDDLLFKIDNQNVNDYASQGQRRVVIMSFKLSLIEYIKKVTKKIPVLLLDDVLSELDIKRQTNLLNCIEDEIQTIITTSVLSNNLRNLNKNINIKEIKDGKIIN